jgi:hypothetical protein
MQITTIGLDIAQERVLGPRHRCGREGARMKTYVTYGLLPGNGISRAEAKWLKRGR